MDVSSYDGCVRGLRQVEADLGSIDVVVNNAGITRESLCASHVLRAVDAVTNPLAVQHVLR